MSIRPKLFLLFFSFGIVPMLTLSVVSYLNSVRLTESWLREDLERDAARIARGVETSLRERDAGLVALARSRAVREYVRRAAALPQEASATSSGNPDASLPSSSSAHSTGAALPNDVRMAVEAFLLSNQTNYAAITCLDTSRRPAFRAEPSSRDRDDQRPDETPMHFRTENFPPNSAGTPDEHVWTTKEQAPLRSPARRESFGAIVRYTVPVFTGEESSHAPRGALVADLRLDALFKDLPGGNIPLSATSAVGPRAEGPRIVVALDETGQIVHHTNEAYKYQSVMGAMPFFKAIAEGMIAGKSGTSSYESTDGHRWLAAYRPVQAAGLSVATAGDYTLSARATRHAGLINIGLSILFGLLAAAVLTFALRRTSQSIERVTEGAVAIAEGNLNQRLEVSSSDDIKLLAESFNRMTDRLREQMARETEIKQFESFMRLSAMLTHDLKNAIAALSLIVTNMERQFHREEFRADAMRSLTAATDKLRALVARLSGPVESLSGEYRRPRPVDLIPIIKRVLAATVEPARSLHEIEIHLPSSLIATVDAERIEKVFENLILNALEAMGPKDGKLTIEAGAENEREIFFSVTDTGPGMSEEFQHTRLFRAFATTKEMGVGLGLYTCREIVRAHGGRIEVKSKEGAGARFRVVLPSATEIKAFPDH